MTNRMTQVVWLNDDTCVEVHINDHDQARLEFGPAPYGIVLVADRYQLHQLIIEVDKYLSRAARGES